MYEATIIASNCNAAHATIAPLWSSCARVNFDEVGPDQMCSTVGDLDLMLDVDVAELVDECKEVKNNRRHQ